MNCYITSSTKYSEFYDASYHRDWYCVIFIILISIVFYLIDACIESFGFLGILYSLANLVLGIAVGIRKLIDISKKLELVIGSNPSYWSHISHYNFSQDNTSIENEYGLYPK